jgi:hypothetical protein
LVGRFFQQIFSFIDKILAHKKCEWHLKNDMKSDVDEDGKEVELHPNFSEKFWTR